MTVEELLRSLGIPGNYVGFKQLVLATQLAVEDEDRILNMYNSIYETVAKEFGSSPKNVEKNIRMVIHSAWEKQYSRNQFSMLAGYPYMERPTASEFLDVVSNYSRKHRIGRKQKVC